MYNDNDGIIIVGLIALIVCLVIFYPLGIIWALNQLFALKIAYDFWSWLAVLVLIFVFNGRTVLKK